MSKTYTSTEERASYGIGHQMGQQLASNPFDGLDVSIVMEGVKHGFEGEAPSVSNDDLRAAFMEIQSRMEAAKQEESAGVIEAGKAYLADNAAKDGVSVTESGLQYEVLIKGDGATPSAEATVRVHYHGTLLDGTVFDSSYDRGEPAEFPVNGVIKGWTEALQLMSVGDKLRLVIPHDLAYGERGAGGAIGPFNTLVFDVELLDILG